VPSCDELTQAVQELFHPLELSTDGVLDEHLDANLAARLDKFEAAALVDGNDIIGRDTHHCDR
jgi:hypothetical protein